MAKNRITGSYSYNVICDVCGFQFKNTEVKKRWDGLIVCKDDYETRHIADFYKPRNDFHPLPFTRDEPAELSWTPTVTSLTETGSGTTVIVATYIVNGTTVDWTIVITNSINTQTSASTSGTTKFSLPTTISVAGTGTAIDTVSGKFLGALTVATSDATVRPPTWAATTNTICLKGRYTS